MANGWEQKFGKPIKEMDEGEWRMAVLSSIYELRDEVKKKTECIPRHERMFWVISIVGTPLLGFIAWLALQVIR